MLRDASCVAVACAGTEYNRSHARAPLPAAQAVSMTFQTGRRSVGVAHSASVGVEDVAATCRVGFADAPSELFKTALVIGYRGGNPTVLAGRSIQ
jgi:hypothetical protein